MDADYPVKIVGEVSIYPYNKTFPFIFHRAQAALIWYRDRSHWRCFPFSTLLLLFPKAQTTLSANYFVPPNIWDIMYST